MKDNFLLKKTQQDVFNELTDEEAGKLIKGIFKYANTGDSELNGYLKVIFIPIKTEIDKNEERYEEVCKKNRENGQLGGRPKKDEEKEENPMVSLETQKNPTVSKKTDGNPKNPIYHNHNHNHNHISPITNNLEKRGYRGEKPLSDTKDVGLLTEISKEVIDHLNTRIGTNYKHTTNKTKDLIKARLNEGFTVEDFKTVIDKKSYEWMNTDMQKYLRPETLFGTKFESYLNQKVKERKITTKDLKLDLSDF